MSKIILIAHDKVSHSMAGPAIRYFEFAKSLAKFYEVILFIPNDVEIEEGSFPIKKYRSKEFLKELDHAQAVISQQFPPFVVYQAKKHNIRLILDAYDPISIEILELFKHKSLKEQNKIFRRSQADLMFSMKVADFILCANERQKDLWLGLLLSLNKINPLSYQINPSLDHLIAIVPFGLSHLAPEKNGPGLKELLKLKPTDKVILWGGGIWNWFDPLTLIKAFNALRVKREDVHLVFMGVKHPNENIPEMQMCQQAVELAKELNLFNQSVHFNFGWIPYNQRQNFLLEADIGVSTHFDHLETRFSFRTRLLDYLWAEIPMLTSKGDFFASLIESKGLGLTVTCEETKALTEAMEQLLDNKALQLQCQANLKALKPSFEWDQLMQPIHHYLTRTFVKKPKALQMKDCFLAIQYYVREKGFIHLLFYIWKKLSSKFIYAKN